MKYSIKYNYDTGDSFNNEYGLERYLELEWDNIEVAKQNLKRIEEHYEQYKTIHGYLSQRKQSKDVYEENQHKDWFVKEYPDICITLYTDDGRPCQITAPWCGYFETLNYVEIESKIDTLRYTP